MATLTVYPDAGTGGTTCDGIIRRWSVDEAFSTIRAGAGVQAVLTNTQAYLCNLNASATLDQYGELRRSIFTFDTSSIGSGSTIDSTIISFFGKNKNNGLGSTDLIVVSANPASNNNLITTDFSALGEVSFGSISYASYNASDAYNDITLNSSGENNIDKAGISRFGCRLEWDRANSFGGSWSSEASTYYEGKFSDQTDTTSDPKLTIEYTEALDSSSFFQLF